MSHGDVLRLLDERKQARMEELETLRSQAARITDLVKRCEGELERLVVAHEVVGGLPVPLVDTPPVTGPGVGPLVGEPEDPDEQVLALLVPGRTVRCGQVVAGLGGNPLAPRDIERVRRRLKRLVAVGRVVEDGPGLFTPTGVDLADIELGA